MSIVLRSIIGRVNTRMATLITEANTHLNRPQANNNPVEIATTIKKLKAVIKTLESYLREWDQIIARLIGDARTHEENLCIAWTDGQGRIPADILDEALAILTDLEIEIKLNLIQASRNVVAPALNAGEFNGNSRPLTDNCPNNTNSTPAITQPLIQDTIEEKPHNTIPGAFHQEDFGDEGPAFLMAGKVPVSIRDTSSPVMASIFFDNYGSQNNVIITKDFVDKITPRKIGDGVMSVIGFGCNQPVHFESPRYLVDLQLADSTCNEMILRQIYEIHPGLFRSNTIFKPFYGGEGPNNSFSVGSVIASPAIIAASYLDEMPTKDCNAAVMEQFRQSIQRDLSGRYEVNWPWKNAQQLPADNFGLAFSRLSALLNRLRTNPVLLEKIGHIFKDYKERGIIEGASRTNNREYYMSHHLVVNYASKLRQVFDASAHTKGAFSLNDCLLPGPNLVPLLVEILLRFRAAPVPVLADIEKAFLMISLANCEREFCKFLWVKNPLMPPTPDNLEILRFCRIAFGITSSPYILAEITHSHLAKEGGDLGKEISANLYVDNVLPPCQTVAEAQEKSHLSQQIFASAQMRLCAFTAHILEAIANIPVADRLEDEEPKVLGIRLDLKMDEQKLQFPPIDLSAPGITRRHILAYIASFFDPIVLGCPLTAQIIQLLS